jgi:hypothetical protein
MRRAGLARQRATHHAVQRVIPFRRNEDVVDAMDSPRSIGSSPRHPRGLPERGALGPRRVWVSLPSKCTSCADPKSKSQIALEYAYRRSRDPACSVFWVHADNETTFRQDYNAIAKRLGRAVWMGRSC